jgi:hypothetical protein
VSLEVETKDCKSAHTNQLYHVALVRARQRTAKSKNGDGGGGEVGLEVELLHESTGRMVHSTARHSTAPQSRGFGEGGSIDFFQSRQLRVSLTPLATAYFCRLASWQPLGIPAVCLGS